MQDEGGRSVENFDEAWKRWRDFHLTDPPLIANLRARIGEGSVRRSRRRFRCA